MTSLAPRVATSYDAHNAYAYEEESDAEDERDAEALHGSDLGGHDERERNSHEEYVGDDVADLIGVDPDAPDRAVSRVGVYLPVPSKRCTSSEDCGDGCCERQE